MANGISNARHQVDMICDYSEAEHIGEAGMRRSIVLTYTLTADVPVTLDEKGLVLGEPSTVPHFLIGSEPGRIQTLAVVADPWLCWAKLLQQCCTIRDISSPWTQKGRILKPARAD